MANVGSPQWNADMKAYAEAQSAAISAGSKGWEHANCDHAYGYCPVEAGKAIAKEEWESIKAHGSAMNAALAAWDAEYA